MKKLMIISVAVVVGFLLLGNVFSTAGRWGSSFNETAAFIGALIGGVVGWLISRGAVKDDLTTAAAVTAAKSMDIKDDVVSKYKELRQK